MAQAQNETHNEVVLLSTSLYYVDDLYIKKVRGKYVISSMPDEMVFGIPGTLLECQKCMDNASWRGVLIGACQECEIKYSGLSIGFDEKESPEARPDYSSAKPFGFDCGYARKVCDKIDEIFAQNEALCIPQKPRAIKSEDVYSFYGLASLQLNDYTLLYQGYSCDAFYERYNLPCLESYETRHDAIAEAIHVLRCNFDPFSKEFFNKCEKMEKKWIMCPEATSQEEVDEKMRKEKEKIKKPMRECHYCGDIKETKKCGQCKSVRYCSVACQSRDWYKGGAYACLNGEVSSPHKESCEYLRGLRLEQEEYEAEHVEAEHVEAEQQRKEDSVDDINDELDREAGHWWMRVDRSL